MPAPTRGDVWRAGVAWLLLVALGEVAVTRIDLLPPAASAQAEEVDRAFSLLLVYSVPVFAFVVVVLGYAVVRWRTDNPTEDGPALADHGAFSWGWLAVSTGLAALLFVYPGVTGLLALSEQPEPGLVVEVDGVQWHWDLTYPELGLEIENASELVLPVEETIRFDITSADVVHSFWVPSFRVKQDAIPGEVTTAYVTTTETGGFPDDFNMRLQCAELCGTGHARMYIPVRVVTAEEFQAWVSGMAGSGAAADPMEGMDMDTSGEG